jgi:hypothetical protein
MVHHPFCALSDLYDQKPLQPAVGSNGCATRGSEKEST